MSVGLKAISGIALTLLLIGVLPLAFDTQPVKGEAVIWTPEATYFYGNYTAKVFTAVGGAVDTSTEWTRDFADRIAIETDLVVHVIDVRVSMARVWWELSQSSDLSNRIFPGRWTWNRWTPEQLGISFTPQACYDRLKEAEGMAVDQFSFPANWLPVDWSFEAVMYYRNPGEPYYNIPDQPDMKDILLNEAGGYTEEFRYMFANATTKAEAIASADDKVVDVQDLRNAIVTIFYQQYPSRYPTLADAQSRLETLEAEVTSFPVVSFTYTPTNPMVDEAVTFDASASYDPNGSIIGYEWDFGDGNVTTISSPMINHIYKIAGAYFVILTVTDNEGLMSVAVKSIKPARASIIIYIRADGSVDPSTANIASIDNVTYYFTGNNYDGFVVERSHIIIDGGGYTLQGPAGFGFNLTIIENVTIKNTNIEGCDCGIVLQFSSNIIISENTITNNQYGVLLYSSSGNSISGNNIANNEFGIGLALSSGNSISENNITNNEFGLYLYLSSDNKSHHNNFIDNSIQAVSDPYQSIYVNIWDDGYPSGGNYWSDYLTKYPNATEINQSGIGNTPYVIDANNTDHYPLIPEFPSFLILPLFMIATLLAAMAVTYVKKRRNA